jgi:hypothetical protein
MEGDAFADKLLRGFEGWASYAETGKVGCVGAPAGRGLLEDDGVFHFFEKFTGFSAFEKNKQPRSRDNSPFPPFAMKLRRMGHPVSWGE